MERKTFRFEIKQVDEEQGIIEGYGSTFSKIPDSYGDIVDEGAFTKTIKENAGNIVSLFNHSIMEPIGKPELSVDKKGLFARIQIVRGVRKAEETLLLAKAGVITQMSIGYNTIKESWEKGIRHLQEVKLYDVSPVIFAANPEAVIVGVKEAELKPYPNEHACRLRNPDDFEEGSFRRVPRESGGKKFHVIMGRLEGEDTLTEQAYRYNKEVWDADDAKTHCKKHDGAFEVAEKQAEPTLNIGLDEVRAAIGALQALLDAAENEPEPVKATQLEEAAKEAVELEGIVAALKAENEGFDVEEAERRIESILEQIRK